MFGSIFRFARQIVGNIISQLTQQINIIQEQAAEPMQAMVQQVMDGVWTGKGADAFVAEITELMIPNVNKIGEEIGIFSGNVNSAITTMDAADSQVTGIVNSLGDLFDGILVWNVLSPRKTRKTEKREY